MYVVYQENILIALAYFLALKQYAPSTYKSYLCCRLEPKNISWTELSLNFTFMTAASYKFQEQENRVVSG